ncbi:hypothetical protein ANANG_G00187560 [Anguilla anguilla]|uniref:Uncharacterized protein n=1 Tax=Anguilla anguilla TaxID=7936 RepID=A0A9D3M0E6_ANGAN|nr:hypothetical protein ANANG_G00187560 [Anguilla anguilla]
MMAAVLPEAPAQRPATCRNPTRARYRRNPTATPPAPAPAPAVRKWAACLTVRMTPLRVAGGWLRWTGGRPSGGRS